MYSSDTKNYALSHPKHVPPRTTALRPPCSRCSEIWKFARFPDIPAWAPTVTTISILASKHRRCRQNGPPCKQRTKQKSNGKPAIDSQQQSTYITNRRSRISHTAWMPATSNILAQLEATAASKRTLNAPHPLRCRFAVRSSPLLSSRRCCLLKGTI